MAAVELMAATSAEEEGRLVTKERLVHICTCMRVWANVQTASLSSRGVFARIVAPRAEEEVELPSALDEEEALLPLLLLPPVVRI